VTSTWTTNSDGSVTFNGTVTFPAGTNTATGAGVVILGANGGTTNFPAVSTGPAGLSPTFSTTMVQLANGTALPSPNPAVVFTAGSGSNPPNYALTFYVNAGATGSTTSSILTATDLENTAQSGYVIGYDSVNAKAQWQPMLNGGCYYANTISATTSNTISIKNMASINIPAQPFNWWPQVFAAANVIGAVDTRVDLVARATTTAGSYSTGNECARGYGVAGATPPPVTAIPNGLYTGSPNIIPAGAQAYLYLNAENQNPSAVGAWYTTSAAWFQVGVFPVPSSYAPFQVTPPTVTAISGLKATVTFPTATTLTSPTYTAKTQAASGGALSAATLFGSPTVSGTNTSITISGLTASTLYGGVQVTATSSSSVLVSPVSQPFTSTAS
jgi:hypothetical protein